MLSITRQIGHLRELNRNARLFLLHTLVFNVGLSIVILLYNLYVLSLHYQQDTIGLVTLVASFTGVVAAIPAGILMRVLGWQRALFVSIVGTAVSIAGSLVLPTLEGFILTELIWGFFFGMLVLIGGPFMTENSAPAQRDLLFSVQFALSMLAFMFGNFFGGRLVTLLAGLAHIGNEAPGAYAGALWVSVALMVASMLPFLFLEKHPGDSRPRRVRLSPFSSIRRWRPVLQLSLNMLLGGAAGGFFLPFVNVIWKLSFGLNDDRIGELFALSALIISLITLLAPTMTARWSRVRVIIVAQFISIPAQLAFGLSGLFAVALVAYFLRDAVYNMARPLLGALQMDQVDASERATLVSILSVVWNLAWGTTSWLSGQWQVSGQLSLVFIVAAIFQFASTLALFLFFDKMPAGKAYA
ncbi:MAG TPA: MFS transporter [Anaerolineae bacterium]